MTTKNNFLEEIKALENILKQANQVDRLEKEEYEKILESISRGETPENVKELVKTRELNLNYEQSLLLIQRIGKKLFTEEENRFILEYQEFFYKNRKIKEYSEFLNHKVKPEKVLLSILYILHEILLGKNIQMFVLNWQKFYIKFKFQKK